MKHLTHYNEKNKDENRKLTHSEKKNSIRKSLHIFYSYKTCPNYGRTWLKAFDSRVFEHEVKKSFYLSSTKTAQFSVLFWVSTGLAAPSLWGGRGCLATRSDPNLHTCSIVPFPSPLHCWTLGPSFMFLHPSSLKLFSLLKYSFHSAWIVEWFNCGFKLHKVDFNS